MNKQPQLILHQEWSILRMVAFLGIILGLSAGLVAFQTYRDDRSRASSPRIILTAQPQMKDSIPSPKTQLTSPFIRLVSDKTHYAFGETALIDVYAATGGQEVMAVDIILAYDTDVLEVALDTIRQTDVFKVISVDTLNDGSVSLTLFVNSTVGHKAVVLPEEKKLATLNFKIKAIEKSETEISVVFEKAKTDGTTMLLYAKDRNDAKNILQSVEGTVITVGS